MTTDEAIVLLQKGGALPDLAEAVGIVGSDPATSLDALMLGLKYPGCVAEQAAFALYSRTLRPLPDRHLLVCDASEWARWLKQQELQVRGPDNSAGRQDGAPPRLKDDTAKRRNRALKAVFYTIEINLVLWLAALGVSAPTERRSTWVVLCIGAAVAAILQHWAYYALYRRTKENP